MTVSVFATVIASFWHYSASAEDARQDEVQLLLEAAEKQITTLRATFTYSQMGDEERTISVVWNIRGDAIAATLVYPPVSGQRPVIVRWGHLEGSEWDAYPEYAKELEGTWIVTVAPEGKLATPRDVRNQEFALSFLRKILKPYVLSAVTASDQLPAGCKLDVVDSQDKAKPTLLTRRYVVLVTVKSNLKYGV
jgi:hypothetical protein